VTPQARISECRLKPVFPYKMKTPGDTIRIGVDGLLFDDHNRAFLKAAGSAARHKETNPIIVTRLENGFCVDIRAVPEAKWEPGPIRCPVYRVKKLIEPPCEPEPCKPCKPCKPRRHHRHGHGHRHGRYHRA
jgi:hypothetical protein